MGRAIFLDWLHAKMPAPAATMTPYGGRFYRDLFQNGNEESIDFMGSALCRRICAAFNPKHWEGSRIVGWALYEYVRRASRLIGEAKYSKSVPAAKFQDSGDAYFTNMTFTEEEMPWDGIMESENTKNDSETDEEEVVRDEWSAPWHDTIEYADDIDEHIRMDREYKENHPIDWVIETDGLVTPKPASTEWLAKLGLSHLVV